MTNTEKLNQHIRDSGIKKDDLAVALGMDPATLYRKLQKNCDSFTIEEARKMSQILKLDIYAVHDIFFTA